MYFEERFNEKKEDPVKDKITFTFPGVIPLPQLDENTVRAEITISASFRTKYKFHSATWNLYLERNRLTILNNADDAPIRAQLAPIWNGTCICSYNLYSDIEGRLLLYSSPRIEMINGRNSDTFTSPNGFMTKYDEAITENKLKKLVGYIELQLPAKYFFRPFEIPSCDLSKHLCDGYPTDMDNDFRFDFMRDSDFVFKCPDGEMPAMRIVLNNASELMHEHFNAFPNSNELTVEHSIDVIKPIIICFHTRCFEMPKLYDLDYAKRLLRAKNFFKPDIRYRIKTSIHQSLCLKFVQEKHTFNSILQWLKIASQQSFRVLEKMIATVITDKFFYEWCQTFPENARIEETPIFRDIFGQRSNRNLWIFREINYNMLFLLTNNAILD